MSGKHRRSARRMETFARWAQAKADRAPTPAKADWYRACAASGHAMAERYLRDDRRAPR